MIRLMRMRLTVPLKQVISALFLLLIVFCAMAAKAAQGEESRRAEAAVRVEVGIDSLERRFFRPRFVFSFPVKSWTLDAEIDYWQRINGSLQGAIDYWLNLALRRSWSGPLRVEARLNHMCRHLTSRYQVNVFNLNEVLGKIWYHGDRFQAAAGAGFYTGGNADYCSLLAFDLKIPRLFGSEAGFSGSLTWTDFRHLFHEAEVYFPLSSGTELFMRHTRHYQFPDTTYIGVRMKSDTGTERYLHSFRVLSGLFPAFDLYKVNVYGDITLDFFENDKRRVITSLDFVGPILAGRGFFDSFWPDRMMYNIWLQYEKKLGNRLYLAWYSKYTVDMPCDRDLAFDADLGTGIAVRNQPDFERLDRTFRYEVMAGVNFKHDFDFIARVGLNTGPDRKAVLGCSGYLRSNSEKTFIDLHVFIGFGRRVAIRPFIGFDRIALFAAERLKWSKFMLGVELYRWF